MMLSFCYKLGVNMLNIESVDDVILIGIILACLVGMVLTFFLD